MMKTFWTSLVAVLVADLLLLIALGGFVAIRVKGAPDIDKGTVLVQRIDGPIPEYAPPSSPLWFGDAPLAQTELLENLEKARADRRIRGVVLRIGSPGIGWAKMDEIREKIFQLQRAGKPVWAYTEHLTNRSLYLGAPCDSFFLLPGGYVSLRGFASERRFFAGTFDKIGIRPNLHRIERYKSAAEMLTRTEMSPEARSNIAWIIDALYPRFLRAVEADRGLEPGTLEPAALARGSMSAREALDLRLVDRLSPWDRVEASVLRIPGVRRAKGGDGDLRPRLVRGESYAKASRKSAGIKGRQKIAVVHAQGLIGGERSGRSFPFGTTMGAATMEKALRDASTDRKVSAIVLRVDSGGGESSSSWRIGRAVESAGGRKPMVVSVSDVTASGAYMLSYPCSTLVAGEASIVGSIGSITGKMNFRDLYETLGVTKDFVVRGPHPLIDSDYFDYTAEELEAIASTHWNDYYEWVDDIAARRGLTRAEVDSVARGRVWTGAQAYRHRLVDTLGTFDLALRLAKEKAGIDPERNVQIVHYPKPPGLLEALRGGGIAAVLSVLFDLFDSSLRDLEDRRWSIGWDALEAAGTR